MSDKYLFLPEQFYPKHIFCSDLIDEIESLIIDDEFVELRKQTINIEEKEKPRTDEHILDYLLRINELELHDKLLQNHIIYALLIDSVYFLKEALCASTKKRLTVAFSLLRKPFVYNLVIILRVFFTSDFIDKFNADKEFDASYLPKEDLKTLIDLSLNTLLTNAITSNDIYDFIFDKEKPDSLINISNQALHPSTTRKGSNLTGIQNINFVFSTDKEIYIQWNYLYERLPVLLIYLNEVLDFIVFSQLGLDNSKYAARVAKRLNIYPLK